VKAEKLNRLLFGMNYTALLSHPDAQMEDGKWKIAKK